jgi:hypothetical protein
MLAGAVKAAQHSLAIAVKAAQHSLAIGHAIRCSPDKDAPVICIWAHQACDCTKTYNVQQERSKEKYCTACTSIMPGDQMPGSTNTATTAAAGDVRLMCHPCLTPVLHGNAVVAEGATRASCHARAGQLEHAHTQMHCSSTPSPAMQETAKSAPQGSKRAANVSNWSVCILRKAHACD